MKDDGGGVDELLAKISSYNIFNYLVPGALFVIAAKRLSILNLDDKDLVTKLLIFYIVGLIISRIGSLAIEPLMKRAKWIKYTDYKEFALACAKDAKIEVLVEVSNTYRTLTAAFLALVVGELATANQRDWSSLQPWLPLAALIALMTLFLVSFAKQTAYVRKRVEAHTGDS
jgi:hypothetical protein